METESERRLTAWVRDEGQDARLVLGSVPTLLTALPTSSLKGLMEGPEPPKNALTENALTALLASAPPAPAGTGPGEGEALGGQDQVPLTLCLILLFGSWSGCQAES